MNSIPRFGDAELETKIAAVVATTSELAKDGQRNRRELRRLFADLGRLKARRSMSVIHQLDCERGLGDLA